MAIADATVGKEVVSQPFIFLWNVSAAATATQVRIYDTPSGKKLKMAKVWIHTTTETGSFQFGYGQNNLDTEITPEMDVDFINKTSTANWEKGFDESEKHYDILIGGGSGDDFIIDHSSAVKTTIMSVKLFFEDV